MQKEICRRPLGIFLIQGNILMPSPGEKEIIFSLLTIYNRPKLFPNDRSVPVKPSCSIPGHWRTLWAHFSSPGVSNGSYELMCEPPDGRDDGIVVLIGDLSRLSFCLLCVCRFCCIRSGAQLCTRLPANAETGDSAARRRPACPQLCCCAAWLLVED